MLSKIETMAEKIKLSRLLKPLSREMNLEEFERRIQGSGTVYYGNDLDGQEKHTQLLLKAAGVTKVTSRITGSEFAERLGESPVPGVETPYFYVGEPGSIFPLHVEDEELGYLNYNNYGCTIWLIIPAMEREKLETLLSRYYTSLTGRQPDCGQVSHCLVCG